MKWILAILFFCILLFTPVESDAQVTRTSQGWILKAKIVDGDTLPVIHLREVIVLPPHKFKNKRDIIKFGKLVRNIKKVLPYAKIARTRFIVIQDHVSKLPTEKEQKEYLKLAEKALKEEFESEITNLTISQGRLLIKLIDRETGDTSFELIKELKGSFTAFLYQSIARLFGENLKEEYDAKGDDKLIEEIVIRIENGEY